MRGGTVAASDLSKLYRIGTRRERFPTLRDAVADIASGAARRRRRAASDAANLWALKDVSFSVAPGDIVGIIGPNGAGKSTLLKILSRITEPTSGYAEIRGRVGSLLEVGTGFHPELSGRENVYLNGAILGMRRAEIRRRFDEIVAFAEVDMFLDTPVKRYSSGMTVRLAFSVAAHLDLEILIVDEVLAVGDAAFQRKCLGKMGAVADEGRTVLFVSHNMAVVQAFCRRGMVLRDGRVVMDGSASEAVQTYLGGLERALETRLEDREDRRGWGQARVRSVAIDGGREAEGALATGARARFTFELTDVVQHMSLSFVILDVLGRPVTRLTSARPSGHDTTQAGAREFVCEIPMLPLVAGRYRIDVTLRGGGHLQDAIEAAASFDVVEGLFDGRGLTGDDIEGSVLVAHTWTTPLGQSAEPDA